MTNKFQIHSKTLKLLITFLICFPRIGFASEALDYATSSFEAFNLIAVSFQQCVIDPQRSPEDIVFASMGLHEPLTKSLPIAKHKIESFLNSKDVDISHSATIITSYIEALQRSNDKYVTLIDKLNNIPLQSLDGDGPELRNLYEIQQQLRSDWDRFAMSAGIVVSLALIDTKSSLAGTRQQLKLNMDDRNYLQCWLDKHVFATTYIGKANLPYEVLKDFLNQGKWGTYRMPGSGGNC